ncbi:MAG: DNA-binding protein, partial [Corynebacterium casei]|nr:DNA-binding protein [Corynebacterium casei]
MTKKAGKRPGTTGANARGSRAWRSRAGVALLAAMSVALTACSSGADQGSEDELGPQEKKASEYPGYQANS